MDLKMKCRKCNRTVIRKSKFCPKCGSPIIQRSSEKPKPKQKLSAGYGINCPCGKCDHRLDSCSCDHPNGALEIKNFISKQLRQAHKKPHIMKMVQDKYGGLKNESKAVFKNE